MSIRTTISSYFNSTLKKRSGEGEICGTNKKLALMLCLVILFIQKIVIITYHTILKNFDTP